MIQIHNGRSRSQRSDEEVMRLIREELATLDSTEREAVEAILLDAQNSGASDSVLLTAMTEATYKRPLVSTEQFIKDPYYLGATCSTLYPMLVDDMQELFSGGYHECILTGSIGWGKSFFVTVGICRLVYELSCMYDMHRSFGLAPNSNISIVNFSVSEELAKKVVFEGLASKLKESPYFQENFPFQSLAKEMRFPGNLWIAARSTSDTSALGLNVIGGALDETNFMAKNSKQKASHTRWGQPDQADSLYASLRRRMQSRFEKRGQLPGMLFIASSKSIQDDFTAKRIREAESDPSVFVRDYPMWGPKPATDFKRERFTVLCGNERIQSKLLTEEDKKVLPIPLPDDVILVDVPEDFRLDFERDIEGAIKDIAGIASVSIAPFIQKREKIIDAITPVLRHPFSLPSYEVGGPGRFLPDLMVRVEEVDGWNGLHIERRPIINPAAIRYIHIDPSLRRDKTGFCMAHVSGWVDVVRRNGDGQEFMERAPEFVVDLVLQVWPPTGGEIILGDIRRLVYELAGMGYTVGGVSLDSYQSADTIQQLTSQGFNAFMLSVDTAPEPYEALKMAFYENRVKMYDYPPLMKELRELEWVPAKRKVDHPNNGSKDCADALAGCLYALAQNSLSRPLPILRGMGYSKDSWLYGSTTVGSERGLPPHAADRPESLPPFLMGGGSSDDEWQDV